MTELPPAIRILIEVELGVLALGIALGVLAFAFLVLREVFGRTQLISPRAFKESRPVAEVNKHEFGLDCAWPWYFYAQILADERNFQKQREALTQRLWSGLGARLFPIDHSVSGWWFLVPYPVIVLPFLLCVFLAMGACTAIYLAVSYLVLGLAWVGFILLVGLLRGVETAWSRLRKTSASCPKCFYVGVRPAYKCAGCGGLQRDIRPGRLGVFERRCECGVVMPTMVLRAAWAEQAVCQRCEEPLGKGAAAVRDVRLPIFGDVSAGKTRLLYATLDSMTALASEHDLHITYPDSASQARADLALSTIRASRETTKTDETLPRALSFRLGSGNTSTLIHLFDAAGELYRSTERSDELSFLDSGHGLVYVVDPFALDTIRHRVADSPAARQRVAEGEGRDPEFAYNHVVTQLRDGGIKARAQRLAIVVAKVDALQSCAVEFPTESTEIADWLRENGLHNVVLAAPNEFAEVKYFAVASNPIDRSAPGTDPGAPVRWLLRRRGVRLPPEAEPQVEAVEHE